MSLPRKKPMRRSMKGLQPAAPLPRKKARPTPNRNRNAKDHYSHEIRPAVFERAGGRCERCGRGVTDGFECHHRKLRSQGGKDDLATCCCLCTDCHEWAHGNPEAARAAGWIVRRGSDPAKVAVVLHDGRTVRLDPDGSYDVCWEAA